MALRKSTDEKELAKVAGAYERALSELARSEKDLETAQAEREEAHERTAADAFLDDNPESATLNGKAEARVTEAIMVRDRAAAAVKGLSKRASELAEKV